MNSSIRRSFTPLAILISLALLWATAVGCFPGAPTTTPRPQEPAAPEPVAQSAEAASALTTPPTPASAPAVPTQAPTGIPAAAAAAPEAEPTTAPEPVSTKAAEVPYSTSAVFEDMEGLEDLAFGYLSALAEGLGPRPSGTDLEREASEYLLEKFEELGYEAQFQEFTWDSPTASLSIDLPDNQDLEANIFSGTTNGEASAQLAFVGLGKPEDIPEEGLEGKIALIERGEVTFGSKVTQVDESGALAAIIFNNVSGNFRGTLGGRSQIPAISISQAEGRELRDLIEAGEPVEATVSVKENAIPSQNVVAELQGTGEGVIVVGAHYDTVPDSIGASDNSSGTGNAAGRWPKW